MAGTSTIKYLSSFKVWPIHGQREGRVKPSTTYHLEKYEITKTIGEVSETCIAIFASFRAHNSIHSSLMLSKFKHLIMKLII